MPPSLPADARAALLAWYEESGRDLAFRSTGDPYAILVSEVMAQQTQISRVVDAWERFLSRFPSVEALAAASPADVIRAWRGMGYNRRALNLHRAAQAMVAEHGGRVPDDLVALERLPGIGPYTARAVAAIAFGRPVGALDTNIRRVLGRALGVAPGPAMQEAADASIDPVRPADWTHAMMDLGATVCRPGLPRCSACPIERWCAFASAGRDVPASPERPVGSSAPFSATSRWLRGRILDELRVADDGTWTRIAAPIGEHAAPAVEAALAALARDGLVELDRSDVRLARLATG